MLEGISAAVAEARLYIKNAFGTEPTDKELSDALKILLAEKRQAEIKRRFNSWPANIMREVIKELDSPKGKAAS